MKDSWIPTEIIQVTPKYTEKSDIMEEIILDIQNDSLYHGWAGTIILIRTSNHNSEMVKILKHEMGYLMK